MQGLGKGGRSQSPLAILYSIPFHKQQQNEMRRMTFFVLYVQCRSFVSSSARLLLVRRGNRLRRVQPAPASPTRPKSTRPPPAAPAAPEEGATTAAATGLPAWLVVLLRRGRGWGGRRVQRCQRKERRKRPTQVGAHCADVMMTARMTAGLVSPFLQTALPIHAQTGGGEEEGHHPRHVAAQQIQAQPPGSDGGGHKVLET